jgi:hypothetical protein
MSKKTRSNTGVKAKHRLVRIHKRLVRGHLRQAKIFTDTDMVPKDAEVRQMIIRGALRSRQAELQVPVSVLSKKQTFLPLPKEK